MVVDAEVDTDEPLDRGGDRLRGKSPCSFVGENADDVAEPIVDLDEVRSKVPLAGIPRTELVELDVPGLSSFLSLPNIPDTFFLKLRFGMTGASPSLFTCSIGPVAGCGGAASRACCTALGLVDRRNFALRVCFLSRL